MNKIGTNVLLCCLGMMASLGQDDSIVQSKPQAPQAIIYFYTDDIGYGDLGCYGAKLIPTPNVDRLAEQGLRFTNAHSTTSVCTPSRYAVMTGEYPWRKKGVHILPGDAKMIVPVAKDRMSLPSMMQQAGYKTCAIGKWHLGLGDGNIDWNKLITPGLKEVGFDESFIMAATADRVPCVYIRNGRVENLDPNDPIEVSYKNNFPGEPTGKENPELLRVHPSVGHNGTIVDGISRIGFMRGGKSALWKDGDLADTLIAEAERFIEANRQTPFFLYFATNDIHVPRDPHNRFLGKSGCGIRGDAAVQMDDCLRRLMETLKANGLEDKTLIVFSSDNGPVVDDGYADGAHRDLNGHKPAGMLRGGKCSVFEGGTRVPFIVWWPGQVKPGISAAMVSQMDLARSLAVLLGQQVPEGAFPDSQNVLPALLGQSDEGRECLVEQGIGDKCLALILGNWKYIPPQSLRKAQRAKFPEGMLFNLEEDLAEKKNLIDQHPERAKTMKNALQKIQENPGLNVSPID